MQGKKFLVVVAAASLTAACGSNEAAQNVDDKDVPGATGEPTMPVKAEPELSGIAKQGKIAFLKCRSCHTVQKGDVHLTGPNLNGLIGSTAGKKNGYVFSAALASSTIVWNDETLDKWIEQPRGLMSGNKMVFAGIPQKEEREALIAYLKEVTQ